MSAPLRLSKGDEQSLITHWHLVSTVPHMTVYDAGLRPDKDHLESLLALTKLRCPTHGDMVMVQRRDGQVVFWCGCARGGRFSEKIEAIVKPRVVEVRRPTTL